MKLVHVTDTYAPVGGLEKYVIEIAERTTLEGIENVVIYRKHNSSTPEDGQIRRHWVDAQQDGAMDIDRVMGVIADEAPDVVCLHDVPSPQLIQTIGEEWPALAYIQNFVPVCPGLAKFYRRTGEICTRAYGAGCVPNILINRCASARHPRSVYGIMRQARDYLKAYKNISSIIVASNYMQSVMLQNGFDIEQLNQLPVHFETVKPYVSPESAKPKVLFSGRLAQEKGVEQLLSAFTLVASDYELVIAGDGPVRNKLEEKAAELEISEKVKFAGWLDNGELQKAYAEATLVVVPSIWPEPFGKIGVEAMSFGRPVVAFDVGGISDWLEDGVTGFLIPPYDEHLFANKIDLLLKDSTLAERFGHAAQQRVANDYSPELHISRLLSILESVKTSA